MPDLEPYTWIIILAVVDFIIFMAYAVLDE